MKSLKKFFTLSLLVATLTLSPIFSYENIVNEPFFDFKGSLFENDSIDTTIDVIKPSKTSLIDKTNTVNFTGIINMYGLYEINKNSNLYERTVSNNQLQLYSDADFFLDLRFQKGIKGYIDIYLGQINDPDIPTAQSLIVNIKEYFIDFNLDYTSYFRVGKQYLKWGQGYFWNPIDFVNVDKKDFLNLNQALEGVYGLKVHIPNGTKRNLYFFLNSQESDDINDISLVSKYEVALKNIEVGVSSLLKYNQPSRFGLEASTYIFGFDLLTELSIFNGKEPYISESTIQYKPESRQYQWMGQLSKTINWERANRVRLTYEHYYQTNGFETLNWTDASLMDTIIKANLYVPNQLAKHYHSAFITLSEFPNHSSTTFTNVLQNITDGSGLINIGWSYTLINELVFNTSLIHYFGDSNSEYKGTGKSLDIRSQMSLKF
ncbi:hypothetical protein HOH45_00545 [bacterium]|jgi:hypothetical protein|nr:hypothetical protein [bacterium]